VADKRARGQPHPVITDTSKVELWLLARTSMLFRQYSSAFQEVHNTDLAFEALQIAAIARQICPKLMISNAFSNELSKMETGLSKMKVVSRRLSMRRLCFLAAAVRQEFSSFSSHDPIELRLCRALLVNNRRLWHGFWAANYYPPNEAEGKLPDFEQANALDLVLAVPWYERAYVRGIQAAFRLGRSVSVYLAEDFAILALLNRCMRVVFTASGAYSPNNITTGIPQNSSLD
jgi:hypothetical protein